MMRFGVTRNRVSIVIQVLKGSPKGLYRRHNFKQ